MFFLSCICLRFKSSWSNSGSFLLFLFLAPLYHLGPGWCWVREYSCRLSRCPSSSSVLSAGLLPKAEKNQAILACSERSSLLRSSSSSSSSHGLQLGPVRYLWVELSPLFFVDGWDRNVIGQIDGIPDEWNLKRLRLTVEWCVCQSVSICLGIVQYAVHWNLTLKFKHQAVKQAVSLVS